MTLRRLTFQGYKSFATRTELVFDGGITAIVGPNGSGKSNIVDAVRWVLGEQSFSALRSRKTTDLIFAGTDGRSRLGMAEATLTLDNSNGLIPIDFREVAITRRAYRSGENEYFLNGNRVRLRDITELLAEAGLDRPTFTIVSQGMVDLSLSWSPVQRRRLLEEAAGITGYQKKKEEALRRLEETAANVTRLQDIMRELQPQLQRLRTQAQQADRLRTLQTELRALQLRYYARCLAEARYQSERAHERAAYLQIRLQQHTTELEEFEEAARRVERQQHAIASQTESWRREGDRLRNALASVERRQAVLGERERSALDRLAELQQEIELLIEERSETQHEESVAAAEEQALTEEQAQLESDLIALREAEAKARKQREEAEARLRQLDKQLADAVSRETQASSQLEAIHRRLQELERLQEEAKGAVRKYQDSRSERLAALNQATRARQEASRRCELCQQQLTEARSTVQELHASLLRTQREMAETEETIQRLRARLNMLERVQRESYYPGVRAVLELAEKEGSNSGILGPVSALLSVSPELERAVEAALGSRLQHVVVQRWRDAQRAIAFLKHNRAGRATFLPLETIRPPTALTVPQAKGVVGLAADLVKVPQGLEPILHYLLNRTVIAQDLDTARNLLRRMDGSYTIATLDGEIVHSSGSVTGGSARRSRNTLLESERQRRTLPARIEQLRAQHREIASQEHNLGRALATAEANQSLAQDALQEARLSQEKHDRQETRLRLQYQEAEEKLQWQLERLQGLEVEQASLSRALAKAGAEAEEAEKLVTQLRQRVQEARQQFAAHQGDIEAQFQSLRMRQLTVEERLNHARARKAAAQTQLERLEERQRQRQHHVHLLSEELKRTQAEQEDVKRASAEYKRALDELAASIEPAQRQLQSLQQQQQQLALEQVERRRWLLDFTRNYNEAVRAAERSQDTLLSLHQMIEHDLGHEALDELAQILSDNAPDLGNEPLEALKRRIESLHAQCRNLSNVNPNAPEEYATLQERHTFLASQAEDLEKASASLRRLIAELEETMQQRLSTTFKAVETRFRTYFQELFPGGKARLSLTDPDNLGETGVDITVRPPGKRSQDLALLSGGERALTAIALLFALLDVSRTPFCLLDEIDAMLDETNLSRFLRIVRRLAQHTQFIVVSHNRATIEAANIVYGITMAEDGTSRVLSLKLDEA